MKIEKDQYDLPVYTQLMDQYGKFAADIHSGKIVSAYALDRHGVIAAASKMAFGNKLGVKIEHNLDAGELFAPAFGDVFCIFSYKCILFFLFLKHSPSFILNKYCKLI